MGSNNKELGKKAAKSERKLLRYATFMTAVGVPAAYDPWHGKAPFKSRTYGNTQIGDCTRASQANLATRMERLEVNRAAVISDEEVERVYFEMTGGADDGAFEIDALNAWRREESTFKDTHGRPLTIDAYTRINQLNIEEVKHALFVSESKGIKICLNLPTAFSGMSDPYNGHLPLWDIPSDGKLVGPWEPGTWGGHSLMADSYNEVGIRLVHSWYEGNEPCQQRLTWAAFLAYCDEAYSVIDSVDTWRHRAGINIDSLKDAVNSVSSRKL